MSRGIKVLITALQSFVMDRKKHESNCQTAVAALKQAEGALKLKQKDQADNELSIIQMASDLLTLGATIARIQQLDPTITAHRIAEYKATLKDTKKDASI